MTGLKKGMGNKLFSSEIGLNLENFVADLSHVLYAPPSACNNH